MASLASRAIVVAGSEMQIEPVGSFPLRFVQPNGKRSNPRLNRSYGAAGYVGYADALVCEGSILYVRSRERVL
jgi:hypothetical protein